MVFPNILTKNAESGISSRYSKDYRFSIKREKTPSGKQNYLIENRSRGEKIIVPRELFDHFRSALSRINDQLSAKKESEIEKTIFFKEIDYFTIRNARDNHEKLIIREMIKQPGSTGILNISCDSLDTLLSILYHEALDHPNDTFDLIIKYHTLFQFSFTEATESMTSGLSLRKDVLSQIVPYIPSLGAKLPPKSEQTSDTSEITPILTEEPDNSQGQTPKAFKSKLGEKKENQDYSVDYESLFRRTLIRLSEKKSPKGADDQTRRDIKATQNSFPLPLLASDIKSFSKVPFKCDLSNEEISDLRKNFLRDDDSEIFLGFEIIDSIFRSNGKLKSFRFPLYYLRVSIEESGRRIHLHPPSDGEFFLNHLALARLVESFSKNSSGDPIEIFFKDLLNQKIECDRRLTPIRISRLLPINEQLFDLTRRVLIGRPGENGKGGILEGLTLIGIECDIESVILYKSAKRNSPTTIALENDLKAIQARSHELPKHFYSSLLGEFLSPEVQKNPSSGDASFYEKPYCPGPLSKSMSDLLEKINQHNLIMLEGPPGTGKTFTILNLLIHSINSDKKILIVSDQKPAIQALTEKVESYLVGKDNRSVSSQQTLNLWKSAVKIIDDIPLHPSNLRQWVNTLTTELNVESANGFDQPKKIKTLIEQIGDIDERIGELGTKIEDSMANLLHSKAGKRLISPKHAHPTTISEIEDLIRFLDFSGSGRHQKHGQSQSYDRQRDFIKRFIEDRETITSHFRELYDEFIIHQSDDDQITLSLTILSQLCRQKPIKYDDFIILIPEHTSPSLMNFLVKKWKSSFPKSHRPTKKMMKHILSRLKHPQYRIWKQLLSLFSRHQKLLKELANFQTKDALERKFQKIHVALHPDNGNIESLGTEIAKFSQKQQTPSHSIQKFLLDIKNLQKNRDALIKELLLFRFNNISAKASKNESRGTSMITSISTLLNSLKECPSIDHGSGASILRELQQKLIETFPVWICRKQAVSFLFPTRNQLFDLVIIDEAGQCRVDDAIPLLYRAKKLMVVGDEKQTVLDKNSPVDDYLFKEFNLEEHLIHSQAHGIKGGGSHIFGLVKSIKQAGIMLDEHYRCPPDIIKYSNKYVYGNNLKVMQWKHPAIPQSVIIDDSEKANPSPKKPSSGKFKGIEVELIDRFLEYVANEIKKLEADSGRPINVETDVALCYFLLKNEAYIKEKKSEFLQTLKRGQDILDGAGAALQGKERDYIFYLWDINRSNFKSFRQGDDPDKRKGELNVLMSRPKKRAYHYLHPKFSELRHNESSITDYLWQSLHRQNEVSSSREFTPRTASPGAKFRPWLRTSGALMLEILKFIWHKTQQIHLDSLVDSQISVTVGSPQYPIDLMLVPTKNQTKPSIAILDLSIFEEEHQRAPAVINYFFQLQRAVPPIVPVFLYLHELADERSYSYQHLTKLILDTSK